MVSSSDLLSLKLRLPSVPPAHAGLAVALDREPLADPAQTAVARVLQLARERGRVGLSAADEREDQDGEDQQAAGLHGPSVAIQVRARAACAAVRPTSGSVVTSSVGPGRAVAHA